ncbi:hypothetical protein PsYK624_000600 [Phanerochaete sordida]|uniref:DUF6534 domain-containing protein n=1 Tax=Phanerochaete sordida TaxID=48140 RepID=A0A9P3FWQ5_9APHY|nr:hypothetical protein PsYK624_000600 [Phanerochaete sordida]
MSNVTGIPMLECAVHNPLDQYIATIVGVALSWALWGAAGMQTFLYFMNYESDPRSLKFLVASLWILNTMIETFGLAGIFPLMATPTSLITSSIPWPLIIRTLVSYVVALVVQLFFLYRIYRFSGGGVVIRVCLVLTAIIATWQFAGVSVWTAWSLSEGLPVADFWSVPRNVHMSVSCRAVSAFVDVLIAAWMSILLQQKRHMVFRRSDRLIYRLIMMTINTGLWTAVLAVVDLSLIAWRPTNLVFSVFEYPLGALYVNTLLANLNARKYMRSIAHFGVTTGAGGVELGALSQSVKFARPQYSFPDSVITVQMDKPVDIAAGTDSDSGTESGSSTL